MTQEQVTQVEEEPNVQKLQLKALALKEAVTRSGMKAAEAASEFEDQIANLRVELTVVSQERDQYKAIVEASESATVEAQDEVPERAPKPVAKRKD